MWVKKSLTENSDVKIELVLSMVELTELLAGVEASPGVSLPGDGEKMTIEATDEHEFTISWIG